MNTELEEIERIFKEVQMAHTMAEPPGAALSAASTLYPTYVPKTAPVTANPSLMLHLIQQYPDLQMTIDKLSQRIPSIDPDYVSASGADFPTEVADRLAVVARCDKYAKAIAVKDEMLWQAMQAMHKVEDALAKEKELNEQYCQEMQEWSALLQSHAVSIQQLTVDKERLIRENQTLRELLRKHNVHVTASRPTDA